MNTFVVAIDFESNTQPLLDHAIDLASRIGARIRLVHVMESLPSNADNWIPVQNYEDIINSLKQDLLNRLDTLAAQGRNKGVETDIRLLFGPPADALAEAVKAYSAGYLVMGNRGHGAFHEIFGSSVSRAVLKRLHIPVLLVPLDPVRHQEPASLVSRPAPFS